MGAYAFDIPVLAWSLALRTTLAAAIGLWMIVVCIVSHYRRRAFWTNSGDEKVTEHVHWILNARP